MSMTSALIPLVAMLALFGCQTDETISAYGGGPYQLTAINGVPFGARATLVVTTPGQISGMAPCNCYSARQTAPYPWVEIGPIAATRRACPDMVSETAFLAALRRMTMAEVSGPLLILTNDTGDEMQFHALP